MKNWIELREHYQQDSLSTCFANLASNLRQIETTIGNASDRELVENVIQESKFLVEWIATEIAETSIDTAEELVNLQRELVRWRFRWDSIGADPEKRHEIAERSGAWSERVVELLSLLR